MVKLGVKRIDIFLLQLGKERDNNIPNLYCIYFYKGRTIHKLYVTYVNTVKWRFLSYVLILKKKSFIWKKP